MATSDATVPEAKYAATRKGARNQSDEIGNTERLPTSLSRRS